MKINTTKGLIDEELMKKITYLVDDENEKTEIIEYWLNDELVHRSVNMVLKKGFALDGGLCKL